MISHWGDLRKWRVILLATRAQDRASRRNKSQAIKTVRASSTDFYPNPGAATKQ
jgi:hypothetical protein